MGVNDDLISPNLRREAREYLVGWPLGRIDDLFRDNGLTPDTSYEPPVSGQRRSFVEQFYRTIDWRSREHCARVLRVFEAILDGALTHEATDAYAASAEWSTKFAKLLARDGFSLDDTGKLRPRWESLTSASIETLPDESAIPVLLRRMWSNVDEAPDAAIGAAKEAIEATAKHVLTRTGQSVAKDEKMPNLIARAQTALDVHASTVAPTKDGADTIKRILGALSQAALGVNELRRDYGSGHGRPERPSGLTPRHSHLAAQCADAWVRFMLDTMAVRQPSGASESVGRR